MKTLTDDEFDLKFEQISQFFFQQNLKPELKILFDFYAIFILKEAMTDELPPKIQAAQQKNAHTIANNLYLHASATLLEQTMPELVGARTRTPTK